MPPLILILATLAVGDGVPNNASGPSETPSPSDGEVFLARLRHARDLLADADIGTAKLGGAHAVLAVWHPDRPDDIRLVRLLDGRSRTSGFSVKLIIQNGVNSLYEVVEPAGYVVLASKTNVWDTRRRVCRTVKAKRSRRAIRHCDWIGRTKGVVYTPYSAALDRPELTAMGRLYLEQLVARAAERLEKAGVTSLADPDFTVPAMISPRVLLTLMVIEHITPDEFDIRGDKAMTDQVFALVGANGDGTFDYSFSRAGAGGLTQFIPSTYRLTRGRYSAAKLLADFTAGMRDHENAVMAQYCLADWSLAALSPAEYLRLSENDEDLGAFLAAAYNGGENGAVAALRRDRRRWEEPGRGLKRETVRYVREFRQVYRLLGTTETGQPAAPPAVPPPAP